jgi:asparagine synthase (glutamine-hydrolysing)
MGLVAVISTQLWHHTFIDGTLADLPHWSSRGRVEPAPLRIYSESPSSPVGEGALLGG